MRIGEDVHEPEKKIKETWNVILDWGFLDSLDDATAV